jgi:hypothetical protein
MHLLEESAELEYLYHNRWLQSVPSSIEVFFARFAWTVFPLLGGFLKDQARRLLHLKKEIVQDSVTGDGLVSGERCEVM